MLRGPPHTQRDISCIESMQRRAARFVFNNYDCLTIDPMHNLFLGLSKHFTKKIFSREPFFQMKI